MTNHDTLLQAETTCDLCHGTGRFTLPSGPEPRRVPCGRCGGTGRHLRLITVRELVGVIEQEKVMVR